MTEDPARASEPAGNIVADPAHQADPQKAALASVFLQRSEAQYRHSRNPIHVWRGYQVARRGGLPLPAWVIDYFDGVAERLTDPQGPTSPARIAEALGLRTRGGPSKARQAQGDDQQLAIVDHVIVLEQMAVRPDADLDLADRLGIFQRVAEGLGLSVEHVRKVYDEAKRPARRPGER